MKRLLCEDCSATLDNMETSLNLKLRGRAVGTFYCLRCLGDRMDCLPEELVKLAAYFRDNGCELFAREYVDKQGGNDLE